MRFRLLRWAGVGLPMVYIVTIELLEELFLVPQFGRWIGYLVVFGVTALGAMLFTLIVFRAIDRAEGYLYRQNRDLATLNEISQITSAGLDLDKTLQHTLTKVMNVTDSGGGQIFLLDDSGQSLTPKLQYGILARDDQPVDRMPVGKGVPGIVAATGEAVIIDDLVKDGRCVSQGILNQGYKAMVSIPLRAKDTVVGVMNVIDRNHSYTDADRSLLTAIGNQIGVAIENARLHTQVELQAGYLNTVIESSGNAIVTVSNSGQVVSWNHAAEQIYGWTAEEAIGQVLPMVPTYLREEAVSIIGAVMQSGETVHNFETKRCQKGGEIIPVMVTASPLRDSSGAISGLLGISTDMREKKRLEYELLQQQRALAAVKERERLARELHDGLGQVLGYVNAQTQAVRELLVRGQTTQVDAHLRRLTEVAKDAHADVREYILSLHATALPEQDFVSALQEYLTRFGQHNDIRTRLAIDAETTDITLSPNGEAQLMRIIQELLTNVRKHAEARDILVSLETGDDRLQVVISDDGRGFDPAQVSSEGGQRFGLRLIQERATEIGASVEILSQPGQGTTVRIQAPLNRKGGQDAAH